MKNVAQMLWQATPADTRSNQVADMLQKLATMLDTSLQQLVDSNFE